MLTSSFLGGLGLSYQDSRPKDFPRLVAAGLFKLSTSQNERMIERVAEATARILLPQLQAAPIDVPGLVTQIVGQLKDHIASEVSAAIRTAGIPVSKPIQLPEKEADIIDQVNNKGMDMEPVRGMLFNSCNIYVLTKNIPTAPSPVLAPERELTRSPSPLPPPPPRVRQPLQLSGPLTPSTVLPRQTLEDTALRCIGRLLHVEHPEWSSDGQRVGTLAVLRKDSDVVIAVVTGGGKTMAVLLPALLEPEATVVVVLPLKSLLQDYERKLKDMDIPFEVFTTAGKSHAPLIGNKNLILVLVDQARGNAWKAAITTVDRRRPVKRVIVDEAHYALTAENFRPSLRFLAELRITNSQLVIMSGTLPPPSMQALRSAYGLLPNTTIVRTSTVRAEIQYIFDKPHAKEHVQNKVVKLVSAYTPHFSPEDRGLIFVSFKSVSQSLAKTLGIPFYEGGGDEENSTIRKESYSQWIDGRAKWMVCTSAFAAGNDYPHVRVVIHAGTPLDFSDYVQSVGRAGRDQQHAVAWMVPVVSSAVKTPADFASEHKGFRPLQDMIYPPCGTLVHCIRHHIAVWTDGKGVECTSDTSLVKCNRCASVALDRIVPLLPTHFTYNNVLISNPLDKRIQKRTASEANIRTFEDAAAAAKRQRQMRVGHMDTYADKVLLALNSHKPYCTLSHVLGVKHERHDITLCPLFDDDFPKSAFFDFRSALHYKSNVKKICYKCHVPQLSDSVHPMFMPGTDGCPHRDMLPPLMYGIWWDDEWREKVKEKFRQPLQSVADWCTWLTEIGPKPHPTNLTAVFMWWAEEVAKADV